jgi:hypothetical protein
MTGIEYYCEGCGRVHHPGEGTGTGPDLDWPVLNSGLPDPCRELTLHELSSRLVINEDMCIVRGQDHDDIYMHLNLEIPLVDAPGHLVYGPWVGVDHGTFEGIVEHSVPGATQETFIGELATSYPGPTDAHSPQEPAGNTPLGVQIHTHGPERPTITPDPHARHPLVTDFHTGITREEAELRIRSMLMALEPW